MVNNCLYFAFATVADSRDDYYQQRAGLLQEELESTAFVDELGAVIRSEVIRTPQAADDFGRQAAQSGAQVTSLVVFSGRERRMSSSIPGPGLREPRIATRTAARLLFSLNYTEKEKICL